MTEKPQSLQGQYTVAMEAPSAQKEQIGVTDKKSESPEKCKNNSKAVTLEKSKRNSEEIHGTSSRLSEIGAHHEKPSRSVHGIQPMRTMVTAFWRVIYYGTYGFLDPRRERSRKESMEM